MNYMLAQNPPPESDRILMDGFRTVNIGAGMDLSKNDPETNRGLARAARRARRFAYAALARGATLGTFCQWLVLLPRQHRASQNHR